jgi:hypothetical protein
MQKIKSLLASATLVLPMLAHAHPGNHDHADDLAVQNNLLPLVVSFSIILLLAIGAIREHFYSQRIEHTSD